MGKFSQMNAESDKRNTMQRASFQLRPKVLGEILKWLGWLIAIVQFAYAFKPSLMIDAGPNLDIRDPLSTLIRITNVGRIPLKKLELSCVLLPSHNTFKSNRPGQEPVPVLPPGVSATRDCGVHSRSGAMRTDLPDPLNLRLDVIVDYEWPFLGWPGQEAKHFSTRQNRNTGEFILVPDTEEPPQLK
jgi:hypothetical protein